MNTKHPLYKEKLRIERELDFLYEIQDNQNWIELEKPYKNGYWKYFDLRDDIKNRQDAWVFYKCVELIGGSVWNRDKKFLSKRGKGKYEEIIPSKSKISKEKYDSLPPAVQHYFSEVMWYEKSWNPYRKTYKCNLTYELVYKIRSCWVTQYREKDSIIEIKIAEKRDYLNSEKFIKINTRFGKDRGGLSSYANCKNRSDRSHSKQTLHRNIKDADGFDKHEFRYNHKQSAIWEYW